MFCFIKIRIITRSLRQMKIYCGLEKFWRLIVEAKHKNESYLSQTLEL